MAMNSSTNPAAPRKPWADWLLVFFFAALLWLPTVDFFTGIDITQRSDENRLPAPAPRLTRLDFSGLQKFMADSELCFNDHFGFRKRLLRWFAQWKSRLYRDPDPGMKRVITGQNGWLFFAEQKMIEHYLGSAKFTPEQLRAWQILLEKRRDWLAARGIQYLFIVPPDKHNIYPEELPAWLQAATPINRETKLDQFEKYMREHSTVQILDLRGPLIAAKATASTYLQKDTHWNVFGAFVACQEVIKTLSKKFPDLPPLRLEDFTWTNAPVTGGDLARMLNSEPAETNNFEFTPKPNFVVPLMRSVTNFTLMWDSHNVKAISAISENPAPLKETAVVFHDSFGNKWRPFFSGSFKRVVYVWEDREFNPRIIEENRPQIVISEILERFFYSWDPEELMAKEALP